MRRPPIIQFVFLLRLPVFGSPVKVSRIRKVGRSPNFIALGQDASKIYATSYGTDELLEIDILQKLVTRSIPVGESPLGLAIADQGKTAWWPARTPILLLLWISNPSRLSATSKWGCSPIQSQSVPGDIGLTFPAMVEHARAPCTLSMCETAASSQTLK